MTPSPSNALTRMRGSLLKSNLLRFQLPLGSLRSASNAETTSPSDALTRMRGRMACVRVEKTYQLAMATAAFTATFRSSVAM